MDECLGFMVKDCHQNFGWPLCNDRIQLHMYAHQIYHSPDMEIMAILYVISTRTTCISMAVIWMGLLPETWNCVLRMLRECRERFPRLCGLAILTCIMARAWRTCRGACWEHWLAVFFEVSGGEHIPSIPGACAAPISCIWQEAHYSILTLTTSIGEHHTKMET